MESSLAVVMGTVGGAFQLVGVIVTGIGAVKTWRQYRDEPLLDPARSWVDRRLLRISDLGRRILRLPPRVVVCQVERIGEVEEARSIRVVKSYPPLESAPDADTLYLRVQETRDALNGLFKEFDAFVEHAHDSEGALRRELRNRQEAQTDENRNLATGGIRKVIAGLAVTGVGIVLQTIGLFFGN